MDEVVDAVGEENVVQVITENSKCFRAAGNMLEEKRLFILDIFFGHRLH